MRRHQNSVKFLIVDVDLRARFSPRFRPAQSELLFLQSEER